MGYFIDFSEISLDDYRRRLMEVRLVPSRMLLREDIENKFEKLSAAGISSIAGLIAAVKTQKKLGEFAENAGIDENYLKILYREIKSTIPKPNLFRDFPNLDSRTVESLAGAGIRKTTELYDRIINKESRSAFMHDSGIDAETVLKLAKLTDLSRIQWVNHTFAWMLYELGYDTAEKLAGANPEELHSDVNIFNSEHNVYHHPFGISDMYRVIYAASEIPFEIEY